MTVWIDHDSLDQIILGGIASPGVCTISGHDREEDWDVQEADGQNGAATVHKGRKVSSFTIQFHLVTDDVSETDDLAAWEGFQRLIESTVSGEERRPLEIYHPDLARQRITTVSLKRMGGMVHDGSGGAMVDVEFLEYFPPRPKPAKKTGGAKKKAKDPSTGDPGGPDPNDPITVGANQINDLLGEL